MAKTALTIAQDAALRLGLAQPTVLFTSTGRTEAELRSALIEASEKILHSHDWSALKVLETHVGDDSTTEYALPDDYLRMPKDAQLWSDKWQAPLESITPEEWLNIEVRDFDSVYGRWTIYGGNIVHRPALASDETAKFWYISDKVVKASNGTTKADFENDDDTFCLDDRTLELALVAEFRKRKGLDYGEEMAEADLSLSRAIDRDKGARIISQAINRSGMTGKIAYPKTVVVP